MSEDFVVSDAAKVKLQRAKEACGNDFQKLIGASDKVEDFSVLDQIIADLVSFFSLTGEKDPFSLLINGFGGLLDAVGDTVNYKTRFVERVVERALTTKDILNKYKAATPRSRQAVTFAEILKTRKVLKHVPR